MKKIVRLTSPIVAAALLGFGLTSLAAPAAFAGELGTLTLNPASGGPTSVVGSKTSGPCPNQDNAVQMIIYGAGFPPHGQNMTSVGQPAGMHTHGFLVPGEAQLSDIAAYSYPPVIYKGTYTIAVQCRTLTDASSTDVFVGAITFTSDGNWKVANPHAAKAPTTTPVVGGKPHTIKVTPTHTAASKPAATTPAALPSATPTASASPAGNSGATPSASQSTEASPVAASSSSMNPLVTLLLGLLIGAGAVAVFLVIRRRRGAA